MDSCMFVCMFVYPGLQIQIWVEFLNFIQINKKKTMDQDLYEMGWIRYPASLILQYSGLLVSLPA